MPYQLIPDFVSYDTVTALEELLEGARAGLIVGIAFGVMLKECKFFVNTAGIARSDPTLTRGVLRALDDELQDLVHGRVELSTTI